jgi:hypothetical protein
VTYTPEMTLYIAINARTGQVISTIEKSEPIYTFPLSSDKVPDMSTWLLYLDDNSTYQIKKE